MSNSASAHGWGGLTRQGWRSQGERQVLPQSTFAGTKEPRGCCGYHPGRGAQGLGLLQQEHRPRALTGIALGRRGFTPRLIPHQAFPYLSFSRQLHSGGQVTLGPSMLSPQKVDTSHTWGQIPELPYPMAGERS